MASFPQTLVDGTGFLWDMWNDGRIGDGTNDAFDSGFDLFYMPYAANVVTSLDGRQFTISGMSTEHGAELEWERSLYVPAAAGWARFLDTATNLGSTAQSVTFSIRTDLGSNYATEVIETSSGDTIFDEADNFIMTDDGSLVGDPMVGIAFGDGLRAADYARISYDDVVFNHTVTLEPGESASIVYFAVQGYDLEDMQSAMSVLSGAMTEPMQEGISAETQARLINYTSDVEVPEAYHGNDEDDLLVGAARDETFMSYGGDDLILAAAGSDVIDAGADDDTVHAGPGDDTVIAGTGDDVVVGGDGDDLMMGDDGNDHLLGGDGNDTLKGGDGDDRILGDGEGDILKGGAGRDWISGGDGDDLLEGDDGDDVLTGGSGADTIDGGAGIDLASYAGSDDAVTVDLLAGTVSGGHATGDILTGIEGVEGTPFDDILIGDDFPNQFRPGLGEDEIDGGAGFDILDYSDATGAVTLDFGLGTGEQSTGGASLDLVRSIEGAIGSRYNDVITGTPSYEEFRCGDGNDTVFTNGGNDLAEGGAGDDILTGGSGAETLLGGGGNDRIDGGYGADWIDGGGGNDVLNGGDDWDMILGKDGNDVIRAGTGNDTVFGGSGIDWVVGQEGRDQLFGEDGADRLHGGQSDDLLDGGSGNDLLIGGGAADIFVFSLGYGHDTISDFRPGLDLLDLSGAGMNNFKDVESAMTASSNGVMITLESGETVELNGVSLDGLDAFDVLV